MFPGGSHESRLVSGCHGGVLHGRRRSWGFLGDPGGWFPGWAIVEQTRNPEGISCAPAARREVAVQGERLTQVSQEREAQ
eukprot:12745181-Alexandrium_andersonii.AAC.1